MELPEILRELEPIAVDSSAAGRLLGISERMVRILTREGRIPVIDLGDHDRRIYSVAALRRWALEASGYTPTEEGDTDAEAPITAAATIPAEGRTMADRRPGRPRKSGSSSATLPLRVVEG